MKVDEHMKVHEDVVTRPDGTKAVILTIDEDVHIDEEIVKREKVEKGSLGQLGNEHLETTNTTASSSSSNNRNHDHKG